MRGALEGIRVIDLGQLYAAPFAARLLADMGAEVIRVESAFRSGRGGAKPQAGAVYPEGQPGERPYNRVAYYNELNRNKKAISLDLSREKGRQILKRLVAISDVVVENFSPRVMKNFGLDYPVLREINPSLIMVSISAYGATGPYRDYVAFGPGVEAISGFCRLTGYPGGEPLRLGVAYADAVGGLMAAVAVLAALRHRRLSGKGQHIDLSLREALTTLLGEYFVDYAMNRRAAVPQGNRHPFRSPHGCYRCRGEDAWLAIAVASEVEWQSLCLAMGSPWWAGEKRFADMMSRWCHQDELDRLIEEWTLSRDKYEAMRHLQSHGVRAGAVLSIRDMLEDPHFRERGFFPVVAHPEAGSHPHPGVAWKLSRTPGDIRQAAPCFAQDNRYVFGELLGMSEQEISELRQEGVAAAIPIR